MRVAVYGSRRQDNHVDDIIALLHFVTARGGSLVLHEKIARHLNDLAPGQLHLPADRFSIVDTPDFVADAAVSIGGDGTFLRTAQWVGDKEIPIIGVNTGHLGFLAPFDIAQVPDALIDLEEGRAEIDTRALLKVDLASGGPLDTWPYALNEAAILKKDTASMITVSTRFDRHKLADYLCDGLIVSTPTGSTGYNLSVGGPIVTPDAPNIVIAPIAAHSLTMRPLVLDDHGLLELHVDSRAQSFRLSLDGRSVNLPCGITFYLSRAEFSVRSVRRRGHDFFATIREKLLWGTSAREA